MLKELKNTFPEYSDEYKSDKAWDGEFLLLLAEINEPLPKEHCAGNKDVVEDEIQDCTTKIADKATAIRNHLQANLLQPTPALMINAIPSSFKEKPAIQVSYYHRFTNNFSTIERYMDRNNTHIKAYWVPGHPENGSSFILHSAAASNLKTVNLQEKLRHLKNRHFIITNIISYPVNDDYHAIANTSQ